MASLTAGPVLFGIGVLFLFVPGPGLPLIVFGLALLAAHSARLANLLDRTEPRLRRAGRHTKRRWHGLPGKAKLGVLFGLAALATAAIVLLWQIAGVYLAGLV
jgi:hypothetical protein